MIRTLSEYIEIVNSFRKKFHSLSTILFRGQSNAGWPITSSLERRDIPSISFKDYYSHVDFLKPEINSFGKKFERKYKFPSGYDYDFSEKCSKRTQEIHCLLEYR